MERIIIRSFIPVFFTLIFSVCAFAAKDGKEVIIVNGDQNPVPVIQVNPGHEQPCACPGARVPFQSAHTFNLADPSDRVVMTVPQGKIAVIENISINGTVAEDEFLLWGSLSIILNDADGVANGISYRFAVSDLGELSTPSVPGAPTRYFLANHQVRLYAGPGTEIIGDALSNLYPPSPGSFVSIALTGYLVPEADSSLAP